MKLVPTLFLRLRWLNLPGALLVALLQRTPVAPLAATAEELAVASPVGAILRSAVATAASLGAVHALAGATHFQVSASSPVPGTVGTSLIYGFSVVEAQSTAGSYRLTGTLPPGLALVGANGSGIINTTSGTISGTPTTAGTYAVSIRAYEFNNAQGDAFGPLNVTFVIANPAATAPAITAQPVSQAIAAGGAVTLFAAASGSPTPAVQWQHNGANVDGATSTTLTLPNVQPADAGIYRAVLTNSAGSATTDPAIVGITSLTKVIGGNEVGANIAHPNGNVYDQVLLTGSAATVTADPGQVTRISYIDDTDDIVQVEFAGAGALTLVLDPVSVSGPAAPVNYNQPTVAYMKGHANLVIAGADETTNVSVFSVGRANAVNQALFKDGVVYNGFADIASIAILSPDNKFAGVRTANATYYATKGLTGLYAPGVQFVGVDATNPALAPVFIGDINAFDAATPAILLGAAANTSINGGDLLQTNGAAVQVSGLTQLKFVAGSTSHGQLLPAQMNQGVLLQNGINVTSQIVVNPGN